MSSARKNVLLWTLGFCFFLILWQMGIGSMFNMFGMERSKNLDAEVSQNFNSRIDIETLDQKDKRLWDYVRRHHITLPSTLEYNFSSLGGTHDVVYPLFNGKKGGFFVEAGAFNGIGSHTVKFERNFGWSGLLVECNPKLVPVLKSLNRKAYIADVCLSIGNHPAKMKMNVPGQSSASGTLGIGSTFFPPGTKNFATYEVQTIPLYSIFASIDIKEVDLFILDIQGMELEVLKNFQFELVLVKVWLIEVYFFSAEQKNWLKTFMTSKGYPESKFKEENADFLFVHSSFK